jgi:hypothetical protein
MTMNFAIEKLIPCDCNWTRISRVSSRRSQCKRRWPASPGVKNNLGIELVEVVIACDKCASGSNFSMNSEFPKDPNQPGRKGNFSSKQSMVSLHARYWRPIDELDPLQRRSLIHDVQFRLFARLREERLLNCRLHRASRSILLLPCRPLMKSCRQFSFFLLQQSGDVSKGSRSIAREIPHGTTDFVRYFSNRAERYPSTGYRFRAANTEKICT